LIAIIYNNRILTSLLSIEGVRNISLSIPTSELILTADNNITFEKARLKLSKIGYPIVGDKNTLTKKAKSYVSCTIGKLNN